MPGTTASWSNNATPYYHFTTFDAFKSIWESNGICLTSCANAKNATVETEAVQKAIVNLLPRLRSRYEGMNDNEIMDRLLSHRRNTYIACFTTLNEDESIDIYNERFDDHWERYACGDSGVCIKFNWECFPFRATVSTSCPNETTGELERCTESRICDMSYGDDSLFSNLTRSQDGGALDVLWLDAYKPADCKWEHEKRMLLYLNPTQNTMPQGFSMNGSHPMRDFDRDQAIDCVYCKSSETYDHIRMIGVPEEKILRQN